MELEKIKILIVIMKDLKKSNFYEKIIKFVSNFDILNIYPNSKIKTFAELDNYSDIYQLMPKTVDYVFLLTESEKNSGHWTLILRRGETFEYFDSYGNSPKEILGFTPKYMNKILGNDWDSDLGKMIDSIRKKNINFSYNKNALQNIKDFRIATCGRWCIYRLYKFLIDGDDNAAFIRHMKEQKNGTSLTYDEIICIAAPV